MIEYNVERITDCLDEIKPLLEKHYEEVAMYQDKIEFNPNYERYEELDELGLLHIVTARDEGVLVGYFVSFLMPNIHYQDHTYAVNDIVYIQEDLRKTKVGLEMFKYAEEQMKDLGVSVMTIHMKTAMPFDSLCEGLGYNYAERNYSKYIGE